MCFYLSVIKNSSLLSVILSYLSLTYACTTFLNTPIEYKANGDSTFVNISGCINSSTFGQDTFPEEIIIDTKPVAKLEQRTFNGLVRLKLIRMENCGLKSIHPEAFFNLPQLREVYIDDQKLAEVPLLFPNHQVLRILSLSDNGLKEVSGFANMTSLERLELRDNKLSMIYGRWFINCTSLKIINMNFNEVERLSDQTFLHVQNLEELHLDDNSLESIAPMTFTRLPHLKILSLRHNVLQTLHGDIFMENFHLDRLVLSANFLNYLGRDIMMKGKVTSLMLDGNPMKCNCLEEVSHWLASGNGSLDNSPGCDIPTMPSCVFPKVLSVTCSETLDFNLTNDFLVTAKKIVDDDHLSCANLDLLPA